MILNFGLYTVYFVGLYGSRDGGSVGYQRTVENKRASIHDPTLSIAVFSSRLKTYLLVHCGVCDSELTDAHLTVLTN